WRCTTAWPGRSRCCRTAAPSATCWREGAETRGTTNHTNDTNRRETKTNKITRLNLFCLSFFRVIRVIRGALFCLLPGPCRLLLLGGDLGGLGLAHLLLGRRLAVPGLLLVGRADADQPAVGARHGALHQDQVVVGVDAHHPQVAHRDP